MNIYKPTGSYLRERFEYSDGRLIWKYQENRNKTWNTRYAGKEAGCSYIHCLGRPVIYIRLDDRMYNEHVLIWVYHHDDWPENEIDHIDRNPINNKIENLREATHGENAQNRGLQSNNKSGHPGVGWFARTNKWRVRIKIDRKEHHLGYFEEYEEACKTLMKQS